MANKTIYGCLDPTTFQVTFEEEACDSSDYYGCLTTSGDHIGQIAVIIDDGICDDTYYACFEPSTGQFSLVIPDNCCDSSGSSGSSGSSSLDSSTSMVDHECGVACYGDELRPKYYLANASGVFSYCSRTSVSWAGNGDHILTFDGYAGGAGSGCKWTTGAIEYYYFGGQEFYSLTLTIDLNNAILTGADTLTGPEHNVLRAVDGACEFSGSGSNTILCDDEIYGDGSGSWQPL